MLVLDGITLDEAQEVLKDWKEYSKRISIDGKFLYIKLTDLYNSEITYHIVRKDKLHIWLAGLSKTTETVYIYEAVEDNNGELIHGKWIQSIELNKL